MIAVILFICGVIAQESTRTKSQCDTGLYFDVNSGEGGECVEVKNCKTMTTDGFSGCIECEQGFFLFRGQCIACTCGDDQYCLNNLGCTQCPQYNVMIEHKMPDQSVYYTCQALRRTPVTSEELNDPSLTFTEYDMRGYNTSEYCNTWGPTGCIECKDTFYVNASMCYNNTYCAAYDTTDGKADPTKPNKCKTCVKGSNSNNQQSYYLLDGVCTPCDKNCLDCDQETGYCKECFGRTYPLGAQSRKCYPCDQHCKIGNCTQLNGKDGLQPGTCTECDSGYFLVSNRYCIKNPSNCKATATNKGCIDCDEKTHFLVRHDYKGKDTKMFTVNGTRIGMCVPHQKICHESNRTATGCKGCPSGYVLDTIKWTGDDGKEYSIGICSNATSVFILMLIALFVLLF